MSQINMQVTLRAYKKCVQFICR